MCDGELQEAEAVDGSATGGVDSLFDLDGDGTFDARDCAGVYPPELLDCDENNPAINGAAEEVVCNGLDENCNGMDDDRPDEDADGESVCEDDCDDRDPLRSSLFEELMCNGVDEDCDPVTVDDRDEDADTSSLCDGDCDDQDPDRAPHLDELLCNGIDDDCRAATPDSVDLDGDGASSCDDCNDDDADIAPSFEELLCTGIDEDCDLLTPDAFDADGDGVTHCDDCDDTDPGVSPAEEELLCSGLDEDCDPTTPDSIDADGDGSSSCEDCDDANAWIHPAADEICGDGLDQDCDGDAPDCDDTDLLDCSITVYGAGAMQETGSSYVVGDVTGDGHVDLVIGAPRYDVASGQNDDVGAVWVLHGPVPTFTEHDLADPGASGLVYTLLTGEFAGDLAGTAVALGDFDADGELDLAVGAPGSDAGPTDAGAVYLLRGPLPAGVIDLSTSDDILVGVAGFEGLGETLAALPDVDIDGVDDLAVGSPNGSGGGRPERGYTYLVSGLAIPFDGLEGAIVEVGGRLRGERGQDHLGGSLAAADINGDGMLDVLVGAANPSSANNSPGHVYGIQGSYQALSDLASDPVSNRAWFEVEGFQPDDQLGASVASAGDVNADGFDSFLVGAPTWDGPAGADEGAVFVFSSPAPGPVLEPAQAVTVLEGGSIERGIGSAVASAGDVNGDGLGDFLVGAPGAMLGAGEVLLVFGPLTPGSHVASSLAGATLPGQGLHWRVGEYLASGGDLTGDGLSDVIIGAPGFDKAGNQAEAGALFVCAGSDL